MLVNTLALIGFQSTRFAEWFFNFEQQTGMTLLLKGICVCLGVLVVALVNEMLSSAPLTEISSRPDAKILPFNSSTMTFDETPEEMVSVSLTFQLQNETMSEVSTPSHAEMPEILEESLFENVVRFVPYGPQKSQSQLEAFDQLMAELGPQNQGRRLVIADFEKRSSEIGLLDVLEERRDFNQVICREMWEKTDLIPHSQMKNPEAFPLQRTFDFIQTLQAQYQDIFVFDRQETLAQWKKFFALAHLYVGTVNHTTTTNGLPLKEKAN